MVKKVYIMVGIPASGKSTWIKQNAQRDWLHISPDRFLEEQYNYEWTPERAAEAWAHSFQVYGRALLMDKAIVWDATFLNPMIRASVLHIAKGIGFRVEAVFFDTPIDVCLLRNQQRDREPVPDATIKRMADSLIVPTLEEGFDEVTTIGFVFPEL